MLLGNRKFQTMSAKGTSYTTYDHHHETTSAKLFASFNATEVQNTSDSMEIIDERFVVNGDFSE